MIRIIIALVAVGMIVAVDAQQLSPFDHKFGTVKFLDSYFGRPDAKLEVRPGDSNVPLTVAIANVGSHDITGIRAQLSMPFAISATDGSRSAFADAEYNAAAGEPFYLIFFVDVSPQTTLGNHNAIVSVDYSRLRESGTRNESFEFEFEITGDSVINAAPRNSFITSLQENTIIIDISNTGTATVSDVRISTQDADQMVMQSMTNIENVVIKESSWDLGNIAAGSSAPLVAHVYAPSSLGSGVLRVPLLVSYLNAHGDAESIIRTADFYVRGLIDARIYNVRALDIAGITTIVGDVINEGNEDALFAFASLTPLDGSNIRPSTQFIDEIEIDSPVPFSMQVEFDGEPRYGEHDVRIDVRYKDSTRSESIISHEATVVIEAPIIEDETGGELFALILIPIIIGIVVFMRRRSRRARPQ